MVPRQEGCHSKMLRRKMILILVTLSAAYLVACGYALAVADKLIFPGIPSSYADGPDILKLESEDGERISARYLPAEGADRLLLYSHGNGEDLGYVLPLLETFQRAGIAVLGYDYPGYGTSTGTASESGCYAAIEAAYRYATGEAGFAPEQIVLYGRSLGSGPSCWLAEREPVGGLIMDSAFASTFRVMTRVKLLPWDKFDNLARLPEIECPVLVIHGKADRVVPFKHALRNWKAIAGPKARLWVDGAGHNDVIERADERYWETVLPFIESPPKTEE